MHLLQQNFQLQRQAGKEIFLETGTGFSRWTSCVLLSISEICPLSLSWGWPLQELHPFDYPAGPALLHLCSCATSVAGLVSSFPCLYQEGLSRWGISRRKQENGVCHFKNSLSLWYPSIKAIDLKLLLGGCSTCFKHVSSTIWNNIKICVGPMPSVHYVTKVVATLSAVFQSVISIPLVRHRIMLGISWMIISTLDLYIDLF